MMKTLCYGDAAVAGCDLTLVEQWRVENCRMLIIMMVMIYEPGEIPVVEIGGGFLRAMAVVSKACQRMD
jgi:hypothetical protein